MNNISALTTPVSFDRSDLLSVLSLCLGTAVARQNRLGEFIGKNNWSVDVNKRMLKFGLHKYKIGLIGTESEYSDTWLWGWGHTEGGLPEGFAEPSENVRRLLPDCAAFSEAKFGLDELRMGHNLSTVTVGVSDRNVCYYRCPYEGGAMFAQIEGLPDKLFRPLTLTEIAGLQTDIISSYDCSHKLLAAGMLHQNGYTFTDNGSSIISAAGDRELKFEFEEIGGVMRTSGISMNIIKSHKE